MENVLANIVVWGFMLAVLVCYFLPTIVANNRDKENFGAILALNLLTGWTFIGWVAALVWALSKDPPRER